MCGPLHTFLCVIQVHFKGHLFPPKWGCHIFVFSGTSFFFALWIPSGWFFLGGNQDFQRVWGIGTLGFGEFESYHVRPLCPLLFVSDMVAQVLKFSLVLISAVLGGFTNTQFIFVPAWQGFHFALLFWGKVRCCFRNKFHYLSFNFDYKVPLSKQRPCQHRARSTIDNTLRL